MIETERKLFFSCLLAKHSDLSHLFLSVTKVLILVTFCALHANQYLETASHQQKKNESDTC